MGVRFVFIIKYFLISVNGIQKAGFASRTLLFVLVIPTKKFEGGMKWNIINTWWDEVGKFCHTQIHVYEIADVLIKSAIFVDIKRLLFIHIMLIGEYIHTMDEKNRLSLPAKFRKEVGKHLVVTPGLDNCLFVFTQKEWQLIAERLADNSMLQADNRSFNRYMFGGAQEVDVDASGRILVPDFLKNRAKLSSKIALVGVQNRIELWDEEIWNGYKKVVEGQADQLAEKLGGAGML